MSRRMTTAFLAALLLAGLPAVAAAQDETTEAQPMWRASTKKDAFDVAAFGDGFVLVGAAQKKPVGKIWLSPDGSSWSSVSNGKIFDGVALRRVTAFEDGVVALGTEGRKLVALYSADGSKWKKSTIDRVEKGMELFPQAVTDGPAGLVAVASMIAQDIAGQRFYASEDGRSWREIDPPSDTAPGMFVSLESTDDEYLAVARPLFTPGSDLLWRSTDAVTWETFDGPAEGTIHDLAVGTDGTFVGVGADETGFLPAIWQADELGSWEQVYAAPSSKQTEERLDVVAVGGPGFLAGGSTSSCPDQPQRSCPTASILASADGVEWRALGVDDGVPGPLHDTVPQAIAANGALTAIVAWHEDRPMEVWTMPAGE